MLRCELMSHIHCCVSCAVLLIIIYVLYCPGQVPMGTCNSSGKNRGWAVARRRGLNGSSIPAQGPTPDANLAARGHQINLHRASLRLARQWRKLYRVKADQPVPSLPSLRNIQLLLAVRKFCAAGEERYE